ncbi:MAG: hypothetical protein AB1765_05780 [Candidatus Hydrogenedentota bacterium]
MKGTLLLLFILFFCSCYSDDSDIELILKKYTENISEEYRLACYEDIIKYWDNIYKVTAQYPFYKVADINNDRIFDYVFFVIKKDNNGFALLSLLSCENKFKLYEIYKNDIVPAYHFKLEITDNNKRIILTNENKESYVFYYDNFLDEFIELKKENILARPKIIKRKIQ